MLKRRSKRHASIYDAIKAVSSSIKIVEEYSIDGKLFIDMYLPDFSLAIEIDGVQHEQENAFFHRTETAFGEQQVRDLRKEIRCKEKGIFLYRVHSYDKRTDAQVVEDIFQKSANYFAKLIQIDIVSDLCARCNQCKIYKGDLCLFCIREEKHIDREKNSKWRRKLRPSKDRKRTK